MDVTSSAILDFIWKRPSMADITTEVSKSLDLVDDMLHVTRGAVPFISTQGDSATRIFPFRRCPLSQTYFSCTPQIPPPHMHIPRSDTVKWEITKQKLTMRVLNLGSAVKNVQPRPVRNVAANPSERPRKKWFIGSLYGTNGDFGLKVANRNEKI